VEILPPHEMLADAVFVEDTAVVLDEVAVVARPGIESRREEVEDVVPFLGRHRPVARILEPASLEGGDVLVVEREIFVGLSKRTSSRGARQLEEVARHHGYRVTTVPVTRCLHLKTGVTRLADDTVLINPALIDPAPFAHLRRIDVAPHETWAANCLSLGAVALVSARWPQTAEHLEKRGFAVQPLDISELEKAEAGLTCLSLVLR